MHRFFKCLLAASMAVCLCLCGVALAEGDYQLPVDGIISATNVTIQIPPENTVADGVNPLTGEPWSGRYQPIMCNIDTGYLGWPHWGVSSADIIYELPLHADGSTRAVAMFMSEIPSIAGPIRSARVPMLSLREMWDAAYAFCGEQTRPNSNTENVVVSVRDWALALHPDARVKGRWVFPYIAEHENNYGSWFHRQTDSNHVAPHNLVVDMANIVAEYQNHPEPVKHPFQFTETGLDHGTDITHIKIENKVAKKVSDTYVSEYYYNWETGLYDRYRNGQRDSDWLNNETLSYSNVIIVRTAVTWYNGNNARPVVQLVGQGTAEIFQNGKYIRGYWTRANNTGAINEYDPQTLASRMVFYDENRQEIPMKTGKTYIHIVDNAQPVIVGFSGEPIVNDVQVEAPADTPVPEPTRTPRATRTPKADGTTPAPVEDAVEGDQEFTFGG